MMIMDNLITDADTRTGTVGGTLLVLLCHIDSGLILKTAVTAATGALVSFAVSVLCHFILKKIRKHLPQRRKDAKMH